MVNKVSVFVILFCATLEMYSQNGNISFSQSLTSTISNEILRNEIEDFINSNSFYLKGRDASKVAVSVSILFFDKKEIPIDAFPIKIPDSNGIIYLISFINDFYELDRINSFTEMNNQLILFYVNPTITQINDEVWLNLIKNRFPDEYNYYRKNGKWPLNLTLYHQIPTLYISVKNGKILDKKKILQ